MQKSKNRLHPQELKQRLKMSFQTRLELWKKTREGLRRLKKFL